MHVFQPKLDVSAVEDDISDLGLTDDGDDNRDGESSQRDVQLEFS